VSKMSRTLHGPTLEGYKSRTDTRNGKAKFATVISRKLLRVVDTALAGARPDLVQCLDQLAFSK
jgi:colanic acid/amylovoran biosynthesis glycosyltransferase